MTYQKLYKRVARSEKWKEYRLLCYRFADYLDETVDKKLQLTGYDTFRCQTVCREIEYVHRFSPTYRKALYAKFSKLEKWYKDKKIPVFLMSLTTSSKDKTIKEAFDILRYGWRNMAHTLRNLRQKYGIEIEYLYIYEPHKSGYPHLHVLLFGDLSDQDIERLKNLWSTKYEIGSYEHGLNITSPKKHEEIEHIRAYVLKYLQKTIDLSTMSTADFVFNAVLWSFYDRSQWVYKIPYWTASGTFAPKSTGGGAFRLWGASRALTDVMKFEEMEIDATDNFVNYARFNEEIPEVIKEMSKKNFVKTFKNEDFGAETPLFKAQSQKSP